MPFIPADARWYLAEIILEIRVGGDNRTVVHINTVLVEAESPEQAYERALTLGEEHSMPAYQNLSGQAVTFKFRGLRALDVIHDSLEHGAELAWSEKVDVPESEIRKMVRPKDELSVFAPDPPLPDRPDYASREIFDKLVHHLKTSGT